MGTRDITFIDPVTGLPTIIQDEESDLFGAGNAAARPASGDFVGDLWLLEDSGTNRLQRWNGVSWENVTIAAPQASVSDNAIMRWDGTTGGIAQGSSVLVDDAGNLTGVGTINGGDPLEDELVKVSPNDTTPGFLNGKLIAGGNITLTENNDGGNETLTVAAVIPDEDDFVTVQRVKTSDQGLSGTGFNDITFDTIDIENDDTVIEGDGSNADRIIVKEDGLYQIGYSLSVDSNGNDDTFIRSRVRINDTTVLDGSSVRFREADAGENVEQSLSRVFLAELTANDFLTVQVAQSDTGNGSTVESDTTGPVEPVFWVTRLRGRRGADGVDGAPGPPGSGTTINVEKDDVSIGSPFDVLNFAYGIAASDAGGGQADMALAADGFSGYNAGSQTFTTTITTMLISTEQFTSSSLYTLSGNEVTLNATGTYMISWETTRFGTSGSRSQARTFLEVNAGTIPGTDATHYLRNTNYGATAGGTIIDSFTSGDVVRIRGVRTTGGTTVSQTAQGTRLTIWRLS